MIDIKIKTLDERRKFTEKQWQELESEEVEKLLYLLGVKEIETKIELDELMNTKKIPFKPLQENILIDFYAAWCGPCRLQDKMFARHGVEILKKCFPDLKIYRCNVDKSKKIDKLTRRLGIDSIPILAFLNKKIHFMWAGNKKIKVIVEHINEHTKNKNEEEVEKILK